MSRDGVGVYTLPAAYNPVVTNTLITILWANSTLSDIASALSTSIATTGVSVITANLPMSGYRHTGVGNALTRDAYAAAGQIQDGGLIWCGTATGTANALILTATPTITAVAAGMTLLFKAGASPNSGATTVTIGSAVAIAVQNNGAACAGGEIAANKWYKVTVDASTTSCQLSKIGQPTPAEIGASVTAGSASITIIGTLVTGTWNASVIGPAYGGTGVANNAASTLTITGAFATAITVTGVTGITLPTSGTLVNSAVASLTSLTTIGLGGSSTGIVKSTTATGALSIAINSDLPAMTATVGGAVPTPPNNTTTFLRGDGTFAAPPAATLASYAAFSSSQYLDTFYGAI